MTGIVQPGRNCWARPESDASGLLVDGRDYYRAFWRTVRRAQRWVVISGWQFDSHARLLRGDDAEGADMPVELLAFLDAMCRQNPRLSIWMLAWDFSLVYALERERAQRSLFDRSSSDRLHFRFDHEHPVGASHHQKLVVVDGYHAFLGGMDVCANRWDDRSHRASDARRVDPHGRVYGPYHDVQAYVSGEAAASLVELFRERWWVATGAELELPEPPKPPAAREFEPTLRLPSGPVSLAQTRGRTFSSSRVAVEQIRHLYEDAIGSAERLIYIENQYFTAHAVYRALAARMRERAGAERLQIVLVLPRRGEAVKEELALGLRQGKILRRLEELAGETGHDLGAFYPASSGEDGDVPTYVHAKVLCIDDRLLNVGSANATNRSLGLDSELDAAWEDPEGSLSEVRVDLLAEHCGPVVEPQELRPIDGLVARLRDITERPGSRLRPHPMDTIYRDTELLWHLLPEDLYFDPDRAELEENLWEAMSTASEGPFAKGVSWLRRWLEEPGRPGD